MRSDQNHLYFEGKVRDEPLRTIAALHNIIKVQGYKDVILDFSKTTSAYAEFMLPVAVACRSYRKDNVDFDVRLPEDKKTATLLIKTNWVHIIVPEKFSVYEGGRGKDISSRQFLTSDDHYKVVDESLDVILRSVPGIDRSRIKALEWALNEITDNVLNHAQSAIGGVMQVMTFPQREQIDFYVCDAGITIPRSLRSSRSDLTTDTAAVRAAIEEGVTRNKETNQGNGLFGTFRCCEVSGGEFDIISGMVMLNKKPGILNVVRNNIPFHGTYIRASIGYHYDKLLEKALVFRGRQHDPAFDYIDRIYQSHGEAISFVVKNELTAFGSREAGRFARTKIENLMDGGRQSIEFDFSEILLISSSFADEVFGKIFEMLGPIRFGQLCIFSKMNDTVRVLIDRSISQRMRL